MRSHSKGCVRFSQCSSCTAPYWSRLLSSSFQWSCYLLWSAESHVKHLVWFHVRPPLAPIHVRSRAAWSICHTSVYFYSSRSWSLWDDQRNEPISPCPCAWTWGSSIRLFGVFSFCLSPERPQICHRKLSRGQCNSVAQCSSGNDCTSSSKWPIHRHFVSRANHSRFFLRVSHLWERARGSESFALGLWSFQLHFLQQKMLFLVSNVSTGLWTEASWIRCFFFWVRKDWFRGWVRSFPEESQPTRVPRSSLAARPRRRQRTQQRPSCHTNH